MSVIEANDGLDMPRLHGNGERDVVLENVTVIVAGQMACFRVFPWLTTGSSQKAVERFLDEIPEYPASEHRTMAEIYDLKGDELGFAVEAELKTVAYRAQETESAVEFISTGPASNVQLTLEI